MYNIYVSRQESRWIKPKYLWTDCRRKVGQVWMENLWILKSFDKLEDAKKALNSIDEWFWVDRVKRTWHDECNVYSLLGEGKALDLYEHDEHIHYLAYIDTPEEES